jgi:hypothetical protein
MSRRRWLWLTLATLVLLGIGVWRFGENRRQAEAEPQTIHEAAAMVRESGLHVTCLRPDDRWDAGFVAAEVEIPFEEAGWFRLPPPRQAVRGRRSGRSAWAIRGRAGVAPLAAASSVAIRPS